MEVDGDANGPGGYRIRPYAVGVGVPDDPWGVTVTRTATGGYGIRPYGVGVGVPDDPWGLMVTRTATGRIHAAQAVCGRGKTCRETTSVGAGRLTAHNERRQPAKLARLCG